MEKQRHTCLGTGIFNLDTIVVREYPGGEGRRKFIEDIALEEVGGTCGNVMCMLSHLGWQALPLSKFDDSEEGLKMTSDLRAYGCDTRFVTNTPNGGTTLLRCTHKTSEDGVHTISFRTGSPGGSRFPKRKFIRARDEAAAFLESLDFVPDVFFFDDPAAGHRVLASGLRGKGSLVYFEPSQASTKADFESVALSDIVKFSGQNIPDVSFTDQYGNKLFIQTMGKDGLRFNLRGEGWVCLPPASNNYVVDWEGAGDWTSAAFIDALGKSGPLTFGSLTADRVRNALSEAQRVASRSVSYLGSKGMIHNRNKE